MLHMVYLRFFIPLAQDWDLVASLVSGTADFGIFICVILVLALPDISAQTRCCLQSSAPCASGLFTESVHLLAVCERRYFWVFSGWRGVC